MKHGKFLFGFIKSETKNEESKVIADFESTELRTALKNWADAQIKDAASVTTKDYDNPAWSHLQAHNNGRIELARKLSDLLS